MHLSTRSAAAFAAACILAGGALAQGKFDGVWKGTAGTWTVSLAVTGEKGHLALACTGTKYEFDIAVGADGTVDAWVSGPRLNRRHIMGTLPKLEIPPGGTCGGGTAVLSK